MAERAGHQFGMYRLVRKLGEGGFAEVYLGEHITHATKAAIKILHEDLAPDEIASFFSQIQSVAHLDHPHIVRILEFGIEQNTLFLVMDYAPNGSLRERYPRGTHLPLPTVVSYIKQIADALQYVHDQNLIHRDVKPHNMLLGANNEILLSDFGIAVLSHTMGYRRQRVQDFEGTIPYAAPEQIRGRPRIASDQYALGIVAYQWLSGDWPFHGTISEIASQHTLTPPPSLIAKVPTLPPAVEQVIFRALAKDADERYEYIQAFAKALEQASRLGQQTIRTTKPLTFQPPTFFSLPMKTPSKPDLPLPSSAIGTTYRGHSDSIYAVRWSPYGTRIASSSLDETIQLWDGLTGKTLLTYHGNSLKEQAIAWSPDSSSIATTSGLLSDNVQIWDAATGKTGKNEPSSYNGHTEMVRAIAWSPDGSSIASASDDATIHVWNARTKKASFIYRAHSAASVDVAWSPDGSSIASASGDKTVHIINATNGRNILIYYGHREKVNSLCWSPDGTSLASASDDATVHIWNASTGHKILSYTGHTQGVTSVAWSPDGRHIASGGLDETVQLWDAATGKTIATYAEHIDWVSDVTWSPDGKYLASASWDKTVIVRETK